jgi:hypothetical protein
MEKYSNSGHPIAHFAKLGQQPNNWAQLMPRLPPLNPQFKLSKFFLHPLLSSNTNTQNPGPAPAGYPAKEHKNNRLTYCHGHSSEFSIVKAQEIKFFCIVN